MDNNRANVPKVLTLRPSFFWGTALCSFVPKLPTHAAWCTGRRMASTTPRPMPEISQVITLRAHLLASSIDEDFFFHIKQEILSSIKKSDVGQTSVFIQPKSMQRTRKRTTQFCDIWGSRISEVALCRWGYRWRRLREGCVFTIRVNDSVLRIVTSQENWIQPVFVSKSASYIQALRRQ